MARRYGIDVPLRRRFITLTAAALLVLSTVVGLCLGLLSGAPGWSGSATDEFLALVPLAWLLVIVVSSPGRTLTTAMDSSRAWALLAATPATPRDFAFGRYVLPELTKAAIVSLAVLGWTWGAVLAADGTVPNAVSLGLLVTLGIALGLVVRAAVVVGGPARRLAELSPWVVRAALAATAVLAFVAHRLVSTGPALAMTALAVAGAGVAGVALRGDQRLRGVDWATVSEVSLRGRTVRYEAPALHETRRRAILAVDLRRLLRSFDARIKPVVNYLAFVVIVAVSAGAFSAFGGSIGLPSDVPRAELAAGICAFAGYGACVAAASVLALDADRHAYTLWSLIPGAMQAVARVRVAAGSVIVGIAGLLCVAAVASTLDLSARDIALALVAVWTMSAFGPVIELAGSVRWPDLDWADATEIGTSSVARYALGFTVGIPVAGALAVVRTLDLQPSPGQLLLGALAVVALAPLVATAVISPLTRLASRSSHA